MSKNTFDELFGSIAAEPEPLPPPERLPSTISEAAIRALFVAHKIEPTPENIDTYGQALERAKLILTEPEKASGDAINEGGDRDIVKLLNFWRLQELPQVKAKPLANAINRFISNLRKLSDDEVSAILPSKDAARTLVDIQRNLRIACEYNLGTGPRLSRRQGPALYALWTAMREISPDDLKTIKINGSAEIGGRSEHFLRASFKLLGLEDTEVPGKGFMETAEQRWLNPEPPEPWDE